MRFRDLPVSRKILVAYVALVCLIVGVTVGRLFMEDLARQETQLLEKSDLLVRALADACSQPLAARERNRLQELVAHANQAAPDTVYVVLVNRAGVCVASSEPTLLGRPAPVSKTERVRVLPSGVSQVRPGRGAADYEMRSSIRLFGADIGQIRTGISERRIRTAFRSSLLTHALTGVLAVVIGVLLFGWVIGRAVVQPICTLTAAAERIAAGSLDERVLHTSQDEVGVLATSFNKMVDELKRYQSDLMAAQGDLQRHADELELKVARRTAAIRQARDELQRSKDQLEALIQHAPIAVVVFDADGSIALVNQRLEALLGYDTSEVVGQSIDMLLRGGVRPGRQIEDARTGDSGADSSRDKREMLATRKDGSELLVEIALTRLGEEDGGERFVVMLIDLTARKQTEVALQAARQEALETARLKADFLANMSHEIRTPMNGVIGMTRLLLKTDLDPVGREMAESIQVSGEYLLTIINDILDHSKIEAGKMELDSHPFDVRQCVGEALDVIRPAAASKGLELTEQISEDVPAMVCADSGRLRQILTNLLGNAVKFTSHGGVSVRVTLSDASAEHLELRIAVADSGIGIPADRIDHLFGAFTQADTSTTRQFGGTGLGLSISASLVELLGGRIWAESTEGAGSTFSFTIRAEQAACPAFGEAGSSEGSEQPPRDVASFADSDLRVLVAEDNPTNQMILRMTLSLYDLDVVVVDNGLEAIRELKAHPYDVILMDGQMPEMDGLAATRAIRSEFGPERQPHIIALTAMVMPGDRERFLEAGCDAFITKPVDEQQLIDALQAVQGKRHDAAGRAASSSVAPELARVARASPDRAPSMAKLSHDMRTPLNSIIVLSDLICRGHAGEASEKQIRFARTINQAGEDLLAMIERRLDAPLIEGGDAPIELTEHGLLAEPPVCIVGAGFEFAGTKVAHVAERVAPLQGCTAMIVHDDIRMFFSLCGILEGEGVQVFGARSGEEGVESAELEAPDVILLDMMLPGIGGFEVIRRIRDLPGGQGVPIIALAAATTTREACLAAGAYAVVRKPVVADRLRGLLRGLSLCGGRVD